MFRVFLKTIRCLRCALPPVLGRETGGGGSGRLGERKRYICGLMSSIINPPNNLLLLKKYFFPSPPPRDGSNGSSKSSHTPGVLVRNVLLTKKPKKKVNLPHLCQDPGHRIVDAAQIHPNERFPFLVVFNFHPVAYAKCTGSLISRKWRVSRVV